MIEHVGTALGVDLAIGVASLLFRGRFVTVLMALAGAAVWMIRRPDRGAAPQLRGGADHRNPPPAHHRSVTPDYTFDYHSPLCIEPNHPDDTACPTERLPTMPQQP
jgi:hypothetical protein